MKPMHPMFLVMALLVGGGCKKENPPEKIAELKQATTAYCDCVKQELRKPHTEVRRNACDASQKIWSKVSQSMPVASGLDPTSGAIVDLWSACSAKLSHAGED